MGQVIYFYIYGALTLIGGTIGYLTAGSQVSLIAGGFTGIALLVSAYLQPKFPFTALVGQVVTTLILLGFFGNSLVQAWPSPKPQQIAMVTLSSVAVILLSLRILGQKQAPPALDPKESAPPEEQTSQG